VARAMAFKKYKAEVAKTFLFKPSLWLKMNKAENYFYIRVLRIPSLI
jgi:hypothetical protein